jgi:hypothetical protein
MIILTNIVIAIATAVYAWINYKQLKENQATRKQKIAPFIVAFLKTSDNHNVLSLHIKNIGEGLAKNVKIDVITDYFIMGKEKYPISNLNIVKNGISIFPPQYEVVNNVDWTENLFPQKEENIICLNIAYEGIDGRKYNEVYNLPFNQYVGQHYCNPPATYIGEIPHYLKEINRTIKNKQEKKDNFV